MGKQGTGGTDSHRASARLALVAVAALLMLGCSAAPALASTHAAITGEYGKEGPASTGLGDGCRLAYQSSSQHLYLLADQKIYGLAVSPGSATPLGGSFPVSAGLNSFCGDPGIDVNQANGNIFAVPSNQNIYGFSGAGTALGSPWPVSTGGETCGVAVTANGEVWGGNYGTHAVTKFTAAGVPAGPINVGFSFCKLAVDRSNGDLYVAPYNGEEHLVKFTAASGYTEKVTFPILGDNDPGLAVNGAEFKIYVGNNTKEVKAYSTQTGELVETIELPEAGGRGIAVDENTDTLFVTSGNGESGKILEYLGITTPKATTGPPTGNSQVSGTADPNGVGPITECYFEYGTSPSYGKKEDCNEPLPISSTETVHADLPELEGEVTYHYRLVLGTGVKFVIGRGGDGTIVPHNVKGLTTTAATEITQESATLNGTFEGTNEDTHYYFEWGQTTNYGNVTAVPPGLDIGATTGPTPLEAKISGLTPGITYHYRVVAKNLIGTSKANDNTFKTYEPPSIESATSSNLTPTSAQIDARINPNGFETKYFVEYGLTPTYGLVAPASPASLEAATTGQEVEIPLTNLEGVTYHFRVVAENKWGTVATGDQTFEFFPPSCPNEHVRQETFATYLPDCRAYEIVSPEDGNGTIVFGGAGPVAPHADNVYAFGAALGEFPGTGDPVNSIYVDTYAATRTNDGWKTKFIGIPGNKALQADTPLSNLTMERLLSFSYDYAVPGGSSAPYVYDASDNQLGRWPANIDSIPGGNEFTGEFFEKRGTLQPSPDFSHLAFSSNTVAFTDDGLTSPPGSAYDYDTAAGTTTLISILPGGGPMGGGPIPAEPGDANDPADYINFPARTEAPVQNYPSVSTNGSHILMSVNATPFQQFDNPHPDVHLYMRVNDQVSYDVSKGHVVQYLGMTPEGDHVFFLTRDQMVPEDQDTSIDLYRWNEASDSLTLVSSANNGAGNSDSCGVAWTTKCDVKPVVGAAITDNSIAANGDVYFYSPEQLDGTKGSYGQQNLYDFRDGAVHFVASLTPNELCSDVGCANGPVGQIQVAPDDRHAAFLTASRVTSYDNHGLSEMYSVDPENGNILCVSCRPDGKPPVSDVSASEHGLFMTDDGRVFFYTADALVPQDTNELHDVYEYVGGRARLITQGTGSHDKQVTVDPYSESVRSAALLGVSADGQNVYFSTFDTLVGQDRNGNFLKIYDARSGGGFPFVPPKGLCEAADECHGAGSSAPAPADIGSSAKLGSGGNVHPAKKGTKKKSHAKKKHSKKKHARKRRHHG